MENLTGHTYLALKLSSSVVFMQPNIAAMGKIDLDDTDHVVASANLIPWPRKPVPLWAMPLPTSSTWDASHNGDIASGPHGSWPELPVRHRHFTRQLQ